MASRMAKTKNTPLLWKLLLSATIVGISAFQFADAFVANPIQNAVPSTTQLFSSTTTVGTAPFLKSLLKKPSKVLTVGVEYSPSEGDDEGSLEVLSMKLRQQAKVSFILCNNLATIKQLNQEQKTAKGNFPGPVPIVCDESSLSVADLADAGASAIVVDAGSTEAQSLAESASSVGLETIWKVSTLDEAKQVLELTNELADVFLLDVVDTVPQITEIISKSSMAIATLHDPMQEDGAEIETGKEFKAMGCASVLVKEACVGDKEDIDYASFLVSGLTSKASKEFKFSGLTGSTNGHFGGIQANSSIKWERKARLDNDKDE